MRADKTNHKNGARSAKESVTKESISHVSCRQWRKNNSEMQNEVPSEGELDLSYTQEEDTDCVSRTLSWEAGTCQRQSTQSAFHAFNGQ